MVVCVVGIVAAVGMNMAVQMRMQMGVAHSVVAVLVVVRVLMLMGVLKCNRVAYHKPCCRCHKHKTDEKADGGRSPKNTMPIITPKNGAIE